MKRTILLSTLLLATPLLATPLLATMVLTSFSALFNPAPAAAGGWAITSLDPFEQPVAGQPTDIGFTIRQHGVTPVDLVGVGIRVAALPGQPGQFFPAVSDGPERVGHYTASVVFPSGSTFSWLVEQGFFGPQDLGEVVVAAAAVRSGGTGDAWQHAAAMRYGLPLVGALCAAVIVRESVRSRRRLTTA